MGRGLQPPAQAPSSAHDRKTPALKRERCHLLGDCHCTQSPRNSGPVERTLGAVRRWSCHWPAVTFSSGLCFFGEKMKDSDQIGISCPKYPQRWCILLFLPLASQVQIKALGDITVKEGF